MSSYQAGRGFAIAALVAAVGLLAGGCSTVEKTCIGAAMPFAAIGDTAVLPVKLLGDASKGLTWLGNRHSDEVYEQHKGKVTLPLSQATSLVYYIPAWALFPFDVAAPEKYYAMTHACSSAMREMERSAPGSTAGKRRPARAGTETFEEW